MATDQRNLLGPTRLNSHAPRGNSDATSTRSESSIGSIVVLRSLRDGSAACDAFHGVRGVSLGKRCQGPRCQLHWAHRPRAEPRRDRASAGSCSPSTKGDSSEPLPESSSASAWRWRRELHGLALRVG